MIVTPKLQTLAQYQIPLPDFQRQLQANLDGNVAGNIFDQVQFTLSDCYITTELTSLLVILITV
jgi:hypothetical protein